MKKIRYKEMTLEETKEYLESLQEKCQNKTYYWDLSLKELTELHTNFNNTRKEDRITFIHHNLEDEDFIYEETKKTYAKRHI